MNIVLEDKPELQLQPPDLQSASAQFHAPLNSHGMMEAGVSCQEENLPQKRKVTRYEISQLQHYVGSTNPMESI